MTGAAARACEDCGSPLQPGQRYCLDCGSRSGAQSPELLTLLGRQRSALVNGAATESLAGGTRGVDRHTSDSGLSPLQRAVGSLAGLRLPSRPISALLVAAFLGFGMLVGSVAGSPVEDSLAASSRAHLKLLLPTASTSAARPTSAAVAPPSEPPASAAEATPEAGGLATPPAPARAAPAAPAAFPAPSPTTAKLRQDARGTTPSRAGKGGSGTAGSGPVPGSKLPAVKHVFVIMLSDQPYAAVFGPQSGAPYLAHTLEHQGELLVRYYAVAHQQLANAIALLSGQGPTADTAANCPVYSDIAAASIGGEGQVLGNGCVYPPATQTLATQLSAKHLSWRAYVQGMDEPRSAEPSSTEPSGAESGGAAGACAHPPTGAPDPLSEQPPAASPYATFRDPFVYFHSVIDTPACAGDVVGLESLASDLSFGKRAPSFSYIAPDRCHDGEPGPCAGGAPGGLGAADGFLQQVVPEILRSRAYKEGGLLVITVDQAPSSGELADSSSCCGQPRFPNLPAATGIAASLPPEGGGQVGALLLSPFVKGGTTSQEPYNHYSLLRTIEDLFGLKHLGYAGGAKGSSLEPSLFSAEPPG